MSSPLGWTACVQVCGWSKHVHSTERGPPSRALAQAELLAQRRRCRRLNLRLLFERAAARQQRQQAAAGARGAVRAIAQAAHARATRQALRLQVASELHALGNLSAILAPAALLAQPQPLVG